jgi:hypothetical protein
MLKLEAWVVLLATYAYVYNTGIPSLMYMALACVQAPVFGVYEKPEKNAETR